MTLCRPFLGTLSKLMQMTTSICLFSPQALHYARQRRCPCKIFLWSPITFINCKTWRMPMLNSARDSHSEQKQKLRGESTFAAIQPLSLHHHRQHMTLRTLWHEYAIWQLCTYTISVLVAVYLALRSQIERRMLRIQMLSTMWTILILYMMLLLAAQNQLNRKRKLPSLQTVTPSIDWPPVTPAHLPNPRPGLRKRKEGGRGRLVGPARKGSWPQRMTLRRWDRASQYRSAKNRKLIFVVLLNWILTTMRPWHRAAAEKPPVELVIQTRRQKGLTTNTKVANLWYVSVWSFDSSCLIQDLHPP